MELLLGPLVGKLLGALAVVASLVAVYFGLKRKGATEERARIQQAMQDAQRLVQGKVDAARQEDVKIDARTRAKLEEIAISNAKPPEKTGSKFQFVWLLALLFAACAPIVAAPVRVEVPSRPLLTACPEAPHPQGAAAKLEDGTVVVVLPMPDAVAVRDYLYAGPACWQSRDAQWSGHVEKLENRLRAVAP